MQRFTNIVWVEGEFKEVTRYDGMNYSCNDDSQQCSVKYTILNVLIQEHFA